MSYDPKLHHRKSIRLKDYDYSLPGKYFLTLNCHKGVHRFGEIVNDKMIYSKLGEIAFSELTKLPDRFSNLELDVFQIMPNHLHAILIITDVATTETANSSISDIIGAYKSLVFNSCLEYSKAQNVILGKLWHRNFYDHIIRDEDSYLRIAEYIINNPMNWNKDKFYS